MNKYKILFEADYSEEVLAEYFTSDPTYHIFYKRVPTEVVALFRSGDVVSIKKISQ